MEATDFFIKISKHFGFVLVFTEVNGKTPMISMTARKRPNSDLLSELTDFHGAIPWIYLSLYGQRGSFTHRCVVQCTECQTGFIFDFLWDLGQFLSPDVSWFSHLGNEGNGTYLPLWDYLISTCEKYCKSSYYFSTFILLLEMWGSLDTPGKVFCRCCWIIWYPIVL